MNHQVNVETLNRSTSRTVDTDITGPYTTPKRLDVTVKFREGLEVYGDMTGR